MDQVTFLLGISNRKNIQTTSVAKRRNLRAGIVALNHRWFVVLPWVAGTTLVKIWLGRIPPKRVTAVKPKIISPMLENKKKKDIVSAH